jgi:very-short-patch-repair endonuclease
VVNGLVAGHEVDFHWPAQRLVVETDGRATHGHALAFHEDRRRDFDLELAGWHVLRVTWRQVVDEPGRVTRLLRSRLGEPATRAPA